MVRGKRRSGFTLVEILMVVAIIAILMGLLTGATVKYIEVQQRNNTQSVLDKAQSQLAKQWSLVKDQAYRETIPPATYQWIQSSLAGGDSNQAGRVRVLYVKLRMRQTFPMNFNEALYPPINASNTPCPGMAPLPSYVKYLGNYGISMSSGLSWESSACLLMALTRGPNGIAADTLQAGGAGGIDDQSYGIPILNDSWGRPIYFSRVPTGCPVLNPNGAHPDSYDPQPYPPSYDPLDPQGYLQTPNWGTTYGGLFSAITQQQLAPGNKSFKIVPLLASGGPGKTPQPSFNPVTFAPLPNGEPIYSHP